MNGATVLLQGPEISKFIGGCTFYPLAYGSSDVVLVPNDCTCSIGALSHSGPFNVTFCDKHKHLEDEIKEFRFGESWQHQLLVALGDLKQLVHVTVNERVATVRIDMGNGASETLKYEDIRSCSPATVAGTIAQTLEHFS